MERSISSMSEANQVRINELARELEVKAKAIIDLLPGYGVTEKKTHSSSIPEDVAEKVRKTFWDKLKLRQRRKLMPRRKPLRRKLQPGLRVCGQQLLQLLLPRHLVWLRNLLLLRQRQLRRQLSPLRNLCSRRSGSNSSGSKCASSGCACGCSQAASNRGSSRIASGGSSGYKTGCPRRGACDETSSGYADSSAVTSGPSDVVCSWCAAARSTFWTSAWGSRWGSTFFYSSSGCGTWRAGCASDRAFSSVAHGQPRTGAWNDARKRSTLRRRTTSRPADAPNAAGWTGKTVHATVRWTGWNREFAGESTF